MPVVYYNLPGMAKLFTATGKNNTSFTFVPGAENEVPQDVWNTLLRDSESVQEGVEEGWLKVLTQPAPSAQAESSEGKSKGSRLKKVGQPPPAGEDGGNGGPSDGAPTVVERLDDIDIGLMSRFEAQNIIEGVVNEKRLEKFREQEQNRTGGPRKKVMKVLDKQVSVVTMTAEPANAEAGERDRRGAE